MKDLKQTRFAFNVGRLFTKIKGFTRLVSLCAPGLIFTPFADSFGQSKYFHPKDIIDKTEELKNHKADWTALMDKEKIDGYIRVGDSIFGGEIDCNIPSIKDVDVLTFRAYPGTKYAKDKGHVYYPLVIKCIDYEDCGVCYYEKVIVEKANPLTFQYLGKDYATDGKNAYFRGQLIKEADGSTFRVIEGPDYFYFAADKKLVFNYNNVFKNANPSTFYYKKDDSRNSLSEWDTKFIIGDKNQEWEYIPPNGLKKL